MMKPASLSSALCALTIALSPGCPTSVPGMGDSGLPDGSAGPEDAGHVADAAERSDGAGSTSAETYCSSLARCVAPGAAIAGCLEDYAADTEGATSLGCGEERVALDACNLALFADACSMNLQRCDGPITAFNHCVVAATGIDSYTCDLGYQCATISGSGLPPVCPPGFGTPAESCPGGGIVGRCVRELIGDVTYDYFYYDPLPGSLTLETLQAACVAESPGASAGVWSTP